MKLTRPLHNLSLPLRLAALGLLASLALGLSAAQARADGETLTMVQNDPTAVVGRATNFTASGTLNPEDTMFGFDVFIFAKDASLDPTCAATFEEESATAMHSGGNEAWVSPPTGFQEGTGPTFNQPFKITFGGTGTYLLCGYVQGDFSTYANAQLRGTVVAEGGPHGPEPSAGAPAVVRAPWVTRKGHKLTCHPGAWSPAPTSLSYRWYLKGKKVATGRTFTPRRAQRGKPVLCRVTARNAAGAGTAASRAVRAQ
jgi:hypothetical protein